MGFKSLPLLIFLICIVLFSLQNLQSVSLVFFGFSSLSLPLSIWIVLSLLAGILSSLFIQLLTKSSNSKNNNYYNPPNPNPQVDYPPSATQQIPLRENNSFVSPRVNQSTATKVNNVEEQFDIFDDRQWGEEEAGWVENEPLRQPIQANPDVNVSAPQPPVTPPPIQPITSTRMPEEDSENMSSYIPPNTVTQVIPKDDGDFETDTVIDSSTPTEAKISPPPPIQPIDNTPSPSLLKNREASLYSYQSKEKTVFNQPLPRLEKEQRKRNNDRQIPTRGDRNENKTSASSNPIYDAPFRVIPPRQNPPPSPDKPMTDIDDVWDEEDDWEF